MTFRQRKFSIIQQLLSLFVARLLHNKSDEHYILNQAVVEQVLTGFCQVKVLVPQCKSALHWVIDKQSTFNMGRIINITGRLYLKYLSFTYYTIVAVLLG